MKKRILSRYTHTISEIGFPLIGIGICAMFIIMLGLSLFLPKYDLEKMRGSSEEYLKPSLKHWMGTDENGYDLFDKIIAGSKSYTLPVLVAIVIALLVGIITGAISGYLEGESRYVERAINWLTRRLTSVIKSVPPLVMIFLVCTVFSTNTYIIAIIIGVINAMKISDLIRARVLSLKSESFVEAAQAMGARWSRILFRHLIWCNCRLICIGQAAHLIGDVILVETTLRFIWKVEIAKDSWGTILVGYKNLFFNPINVRGLEQPAHIWWLWLSPSLAIVTAISSFYILGDVLTDRPERFNKIYTFLRRTVGGLGGLKPGKKIFHNVLKSRAAFILLGIMSFLSAFAMVTSVLTPTAFSTEVNLEFEKLTKDLGKSGINAYVDKNYQQAIKYWKELLCVDSVYSFYRKQMSKLSSYRGQINKSYVQLIEFYSKKMEDPASNLDESQIKDIKANLEKLKPELSGWENLSMGIELYQNDKIEESKSFFETAIASDNSLAEAHIFLGFIYLYLDQGDKQKASEKFNLAIQLTNGPTKNLLAKIIDNILNPDTTPPLVEHYPLKSIKATKKIDLQVVVKDNIEVKSVQLYYKFLSDPNFRQILMKASEGSIYLVEIPGEQVVPGTLEYYIEAMDSSDNKSDRVMYQVGAVKGGSKSFLWGAITGGIISTAGGVVFYLLTRGWNPDSPPPPPPLTILD